MVTALRSAPVQESTAAMEHGVLAIATLVRVGVTGVIVEGTQTLMSEQGACGGECMHARGELPYRVHIGGRCF